MKYYIHIEYTIDSANTKTAKLTLLDQKNKKLLNKVPVSLPYALFDKNKAPYYFGMNKESGKYNAPSVSEIDFKTKDFKELFVDNPSFMPLYEFTDEKSNFYETFDHNNKNYVMYKKQILCFPQYNDDLLGVDENALILHEKNFKIFSDAMEKATEVDFELAKPRFNLFNNFEDRKIQKYSDINKIHQIVKEIDKNKASVTQADSLVNQRLKEARKNKFNQIVGKTEEKPEIMPAHINQEDIQAEKEKNKVPAPEKNKKENKKENSADNITAGKNIFISKDNKNTVSEYFYDLKNNADRERLQRQRNIDFMFMLSMYNYFILQKLSFNNNMLNEAFKKIPGGESVKSSSFFSNENGFFVQMFSDNQKNDPLGNISFDFETKTLGMQNEDSLLTLKPSDENPYILSLGADYGSLKLSGEIMNIRVDQEDKFEDYRTFGNIRILNQNTEENTEYSFGAKYSFIAENESLPKIDYVLKESESPVNIYIAYQAQKDKIGKNFNQFLTSMDLYFDGKNEEQFLMNKAVVNSSIDESSLSEFSKEIANSPETFNFTHKEPQEEVIKSEEQISFEEERRLYNEEQERLKAAEKAKYDIGDKFDAEIMAALSAIGKTEESTEDFTAENNKNNNIEETVSNNDEVTSNITSEPTNDEVAPPSKPISEEEQNFNSLVMEALQKHNNESYTEESVSESEPVIKDVKIEMFPDFSTENSEIFDVGNDFDKVNQDVYIPQNYENSFPEHIASSTADYSEDYSRYMSNEDPVYDYESQRREMEDQVKAENQRLEEIRLQEERRAAEIRSQEEQRRQEEVRREEQRRNEEREREEQQRREEEKRAEEERYREDQRREEERRIENERNNNSFRI